MVMNLPARQPVRQFAARRSEALQRMILFSVIVMRLLVYRRKSMAPKMPSDARSMIAPARRTPSRT